jgi:hypothetical protein
MWAVGLAGWYAAAGGSHGNTRDVLRVAADGWLLAHGAPLALAGATVTASPLGLTLGCAWLTYRIGRRAARSCVVDDLRSVGFGTVVLGGVYAIFAMLVALLASTPTAQPGLGLSFVGGAVVGAVAGGAGLVRGAGLTSDLRRALPVTALSAAYGAATALVAALVAGTVLTVVGLGFHFQAAVEVAKGLHYDATGAVLSLLLVAALVPNAALLGSAYLLGPGFALGAGTVVSPGAVVVGPLPAVPLLAAVPASGWAPGWAATFLAVPVLIGIVAGYLAGRLLPTGSYRSAALRGLLGGLAACVLLTVLVSWAGGSIGPARMAHLGADLWPVLRAAFLAFVPTGVLGALVAAWRNRRQEVTDARHPEVTDEVTDDEVTDSEETLTVPVPRPAPEE